MKNENIDRFICVTSNNILRRMLVKNIGKMGIIMIDCMGGNM